MLATMACAFLFTMIFHSMIENLQSPIIFMIFLMSLYGSTALSLSYWVYLGPFTRNICGIVVIACGLITMGCDTYLFLSFDSEKDWTLPNLLFMLFLMSLSNFISLLLSLWVYHSSIPGKCVAWYCWEC
jgi:heme/copper-type cytochrome/quinol oxidase subunit 4